MSSSKAVNQALREFIRQKRREKLLSLRGKLYLESNWQKLRENDS